MTRSDEDPTAEAKGASPEPGEIFRLAASLYLVVALGGLGWIGAREGGVALAVFVGADSWAFDLAAGLLAGAVLVAAWELLRRWSPLTRELERRLREALGPLGRDEVVGLAFLSGLSEEVLFRGAMQPAWGVVPATLLFALCHTGRGRAMLLWTAAALVAGAVLAALRWWTGNLLAPIVTHVVVNLVGLQQLQEEAPSEPER